METTDSRSKSVWIINQYATNPDVGMGGRHYYLGKELAEKGYDVSIIASANHHLMRNPPGGTAIFTQEHYRGVNFIWLRLISYKHAHSKLRVLNWFFFPVIFLLVSPFIRSKPDVIIYSSPSPIGSLGAELLSRLFKAKYYFEVRDIWPLTLIELGGYSEKNIFIKLLKWIEKRAYLRCNAVLSNLKNINEHINQIVTVQKKVHWIPNGFSFSEMSSNTPLSKEILEKLPSEKFVVGYAGSIGLANALDNLINVARRLKGRSDLAFVIVGEGKQKAALSQKVEVLGLKNVFFIESVPKAEIPELLNCFDVNYIGWNNESLYRFGIGANKIPEYLYSGRPVLHAYSGACDPIAEAGSGVSVPADDPVALENAIVRLARMKKKELLRLGSIGKAHALTVYEYSKIAKNLEKVIFDD